MPRVPDLVGSGESAEILGKEQPRINRYEDNNMMPPSAIVDEHGERIRLAMSGIWYRSHIEAMRDGKPIRPRPGVCMVGAKEAAALLGLKGASQIFRWLRRGPPPGLPAFPKPAVKLRAGPLWWRDAVVEWAQARKAHAA